MCILLVLALTACTPTPESSDDASQAAADTDADHDGYAGVEDCNDGDASVSPSGLEICDGIDNECDGVIDDGVTTTWYADADADGYGNAGAPTERCTAGEGVVSTATDCNDQNATAYPGHPEVCDAIDNNCDGLADEGLLSTWFKDEDGDGHGDPASAAYACVAPEGWVSARDDCDDADASAFDGADEVCDTVDNDCDGESDENDVCLYDLGDADARILGATAYASVGAGVAILPDLDGNGVGELVVGSPENTGGTRGGFTVFNHLPSGDQTTDDADTTISSSGSEIPVMGVRIDGSTDVTGDGEDDLVVGSQGDHVYVFAGPNFSSGTATAAHATLDVNYEGDIGKGVGPSGDVDGDGIADLAMGGAGRDFSYVFHGPFAGNMDADDAAARYESGGYVSTGAIVGDTDGDGLSDVAFGDQGWAEVALFTDVLIGDVERTDATATIQSLSAESAIGVRIVPAGDVDGDGLADFWAGDGLDASGESRAGSAFLIGGGLVGESTTASALAHLQGTVASEYVGYYLDGNEDVDGDGVMDVLLGASLRAGGGGAYLLYGPFAGTIDVQATARTFAAERAGSNTGYDVALGDIDLDGLADIVIGASAYSESFESQGIAYLVYGAGL